MARLPSLPPKKFGTVASTAPVPAPIRSTPSSAPVSSDPKKIRRKVVATTRGTGPKSLSVSTTRPTALASTRYSKRPSLEASQTPRTRPPPAKRSNNLANPSSKPSSAPIDTKTMREDRLGTLVNKLIASYKSAGSWETFVNEFRGHSYLSDDIQDLPHPAAPILRTWRDRGVPVQMSTEPWTLEQKDEAVARGCHPSATAHAEFVRDEMASFIENNFWLVLPYDLVRELLLLRLTPLACKEERDRRARLLMDHSWPWLWDIINQNTLPGAPPEAMQFGPMLNRLMYYVRHANPRFGPPKGSKHDIKDGFYRLFLDPLDCLKLAALLPRYEDEPQLVGIPMSCTMGWAQSPPSFCVMSETVCDLTNMGLRSGHLLRTPEHRLSEEAEAQDDRDTSMEPRELEPETREADTLLQSLPTAGLLSPDPVGPVPPSNRPFSKPIAVTDVYVDDFVQLGQGSPTKLNAVRNCFFHTLDQVLRQPEPGENRNEAVSLKKLRKGDSSWHTRKTIVGWTLDFIRQTLELPPHRKVELVELFESLRDRKRVSERRWRKALGKLRFITRGVPGSKGLLSALQLALNRASDGRIRITSAVRHHLKTFEALVADLCSRPTNLAELVPEDAALVGTTDASGIGLGGAFFDEDLQPSAWRYELPSDIQASLVSYANPHGTVTNSDFEQAARQAQLCVMASHYDMAYCTVENGTDNTPTLGRADKGAVSKPGAAALLCNEACAHQRLHRYCSRSFFIPGQANVIADDASRLLHLSDADFLSHLEQCYPQSKPWRILHLNPDDASRLTSALRSKPPLRPMSRVPGLPKARSSGSGQTSATKSELIQLLTTSRKSKTASTTSSSSPTATDSGPAAVKTMCELAPYLRSSLPSARGSPTWVDKIPASRMSDPKSTIPYSKISWTPSANKTTLPPVPTQPTSRSSALSTKPSIRSMPPTVPCKSTSSISSSSPSSGSCALPNTPATTSTGATTRAPNPSYFVTSPS